LLEAETEFQKNLNLYGDLSDYKACLDKYLVSFKEYEYYLRFWSKTEEERATFVSQLAMWTLYQYNSKASYFDDKALFLTKFNKYCHREYLLARRSSFEEFKALITSKDCIVKPLNDSRGNGVFKTNHDKIDNIDALYKKCVDCNYIVEECILGCAELQAFHPSSLNTLRVVTISGNGKAEVVAGVFRLGRDGSIIDNISAGGFFTLIDVETGIVTEGGTITSDERYEVHPNTGLRVKGFQIPRWKEITATCIEACQVVPDAFITCWDVTINSNGEIVFVEGNKSPQFLHQAIGRKGDRKRIEAALIHVFGGKIKYPV